MPPDNTQEAGSTTRTGPQQEHPTNNPAQVVESTLPAGHDIVARLATLSDTQLRKLSRTLDSAVCSRDAVHDPELEYAAVIARVTLRRRRALARAAAARRALAEAVGS